MEDVALRKNELKQGSDQIYEVVLVGAYGIYDLVLELQLGVLQG